MAASIAHVLIKTDAAWQAFIRAAEITGLDSEKVVTNKESAEKELPVIICAAENAVRKRAKNWEVTGSILIKTDSTDADGQLTEAALAASTAIETELLTAIEDEIPGDDRPQPLAAAIQAAAVTAEAVDATRFQMTACYLGRVSAGFDEDGIWTFSVDFTATVIA